MSKHGQDWMGDSEDAVRRRWVIAGAFFTACGIYLAYLLISMMITVSKYEPERIQFSYSFVKESYDKEGSFSVYNAEAGQTDSDPLTMASGKKVYEGAVANNCLKFGTKIDVEGVGTFTVEDRMNKRYNCEKFDIFRWNKRGNITGKFKYRIVDNHE